MSTFALYHSYVLPWTEIPEELNRLKKNVIIALAIAVVLGVVFPLLPVQKVDRNKVQELPPRLAQLVIEQKKKPKPPPPKKIVKKEKKKKKVVKKKKVKKKEKKEKKKVVKKKPKPKKTEEQIVAEARKKAASTGLLALVDDFADLRDTPVKSLKNAKLSKGGSSAKAVKRNVLTSNLASSSGGINTSDISTGVGSSSLAGRETTRVKSDVAKAAKNKIKSDGRGGKKPSRTFEEVTLVFDKNKGAIYSIYNRALRRDPALEGKIVFKLTISPGGQVTKIELESSELNNPKLEKRLMSRIKLFNFGKRDVETMIVIYPIDFLPP